MSKCSKFKDFRTRTPGTWTVESLPRRNSHDGTVSSGKELLDSCILLISSLRNSCMLEMRWILGGR